ncbi:MAG: hypothetical protein WDM96_07010 [Lacunisphaera sp.]
MTPVPFQGLGFGIAGTYGRAKGTAGRTSGYRTDGQQTIFSLPRQHDHRRPELARHAPARLPYGSFGFQSEYVLSTVNVRPSTTGGSASCRTRPGRFPPVMC